MPLDGQVREDALFVTNTGVLAFVFNSNNTVPERDLYQHTTDLLHTPEFLEGNPFLSTDRIRAALGYLQSRGIFSVADGYALCYFVTEFS